MERLDAINHVSIFVAAMLGLGDCIQLCAATTVYCFDYDADSNGGAIIDESGNGHDLGTFSGAVSNLRRFRACPGSALPGRSTWKIR